MHPVSFFSKNSICNVNTRGFQSPDFGIPPISSLKQKLDSVKEHLIVCAQCVIFWIDFSTARKEIFIVKTPLVGWKFQNLTHMFKDHSLLAKFWILFPLNLWNQQWAHWLTDNKILSWSYPPCLQVEVWAELWNNKFWVSILSQTWFL